MYGLQDSYHLVTLYIPDSMSLLILMLTLAGLQAILYNHTILPDTLLVLWDWAIDNSKAGLLNRYAKLTGGRDD